METQEKNDTSKTENEKREANEGRTLLRNLTEEGKAQLRKIKKWIEKKKEETIKHIKKKIKMKRRKSPTRKEEMKGGGVEKEEEGQKWKKHKEEKDKEEEQIKKRTQKSGKKRWENKHGEGKGEMKEYKVYEWDKLIGDPVLAQMGARGRSSTNRFTFLNNRKVWLCFVRATILLLAGNR